MRGSALLLLLVPGLLAGAAFGGGTPAGNQFQVNSYTLNSQDYAAVAVAPDGDFVVVWESLGSDGSDTSGSSIQGQRYAPDGTPQGNQFQVNSYTTSGQQRPSVVIGGPGSLFVVVWQSYGSLGTDSSSWSIQGQRYASDGSPQGTQFQVNSYTPSRQKYPSVGMALDGDFVVVWESYGSPGSDNDFESIQGQRFAFDGTPQGDQFQVNSYTTSVQSAPAVGVGSGGDFTVVWESYGDAAFNFSIQGQRYAFDGTPQGNQFQVNSYTPGDQLAPSIGMQSDGDLVVVWESDGSYGSDDDGHSIQGQRYSSNGAPLGGQLQINSYTPSGQGSPDVSTDGPDGDFVVVWQSFGSYGSDTSGPSIQAQCLESDGTPSGTQFQVNSYTAGLQGNYSVKVGGFAADGNFVVVWDSDGSYGSDTSYLSIQAQRYGTSIFTDGFESGDTSAWSSTVP